MDHRRYLSYNISKHLSVAEFIPQLMSHETPLEYGIFESHNRTFFGHGKIKDVDCINYHYIFENYALETTALH